MKTPIVNITRGSLHDGPGMRTVVYFKGCPLKCLWCHNPESIGGGKDVLFAPVRCIGCGRCAAACENGCHVSDGGTHVFLRENCVLCGRCAAACPADALSLSARPLETEEIFRQAISDLPYFRATGGGITLSGGECLLHPEAAADLLQRARASGIHTAIETAMHVPEATLRHILPLVDLVIADVKHMDPDRHAALTGADNRLILGNIALAARLHPNLWIRTPLIPGANDDESNLLATARFVSSLGDGVKVWELLRFNGMGSGKYESLGRAYAYSQAEPQTDAEMERIDALLRPNLKDPGLLKWQ